MNKRLLQNDISYGLSTWGLAKKYNRSQTNIRLWLKKFELKTDPKTKSKIKYDPSYIQQLINDGLTYRDIKEKIGISQSCLAKYSKRGLIKTRNPSEASKLSYNQGRSNLSKMTKSERSLGGQKGGGYRKNAGRGKGDYVFDSYGKKTYLQSSYELMCDQILKSLNINWSRPEPFNYKLDGKIKKYYPDFYLNDLDKYIDTKNDYLIKLDKKKIKIVEEQNNVTINILSLKEITENFIKNLASPKSEGHS